MILKLDRAQQRRLLDPRIIISNCHCVPRHVSGGLFSREHLDVLSRGETKKKKEKKDSRE